MSSALVVDANDRTSCALLPPASTAADAIATLVVGLRRAVTLALRDGSRDSVLEKAALPSRLLMFGDSSSSKAVASWMKAELDDCLCDRLVRLGCCRDGHPSLDWCVSAVAKLSPSLWSALTTTRTENEYRCLHTSDTDLLTYIAEKVCQSASARRAGAPGSRSPPLSGFAAHCLPPDALFSLSRFWLQRGARQTTNNVPFADGLSDACKNGKPVRPTEVSSPFTFLGNWLRMWLEARGERSTPSRGTTATFSSECGASYTSTLPPVMLRDFIQWMQARRGAALGPPVRPVTDSALGQELSLVAQGISVEEFGKLLRKAAVPPRQVSGGRQEQQRQSSSVTGAIPSSVATPHRGTARDVGTGRAPGRTAKRKAVKRQRSPSTSSSSASSASTASDSGDTSESEHSSPRRASSGGESDPIQEIVRRHKKQHSAVPQS